MLCSLLPPSPLAPVRAQSGNADFASAVACLDGDLSLATTCFADTIFAPVSANDPALVRVTLSGVKQALAPIGTTTGGTKHRIAVNSGIGSVYGLAYDDGAISGVRRVFAAAFTRRFTSFGPLGPGGVYEYRFDDGQWHPSFTVPDVGDDRSNDNSADDAILKHVGQTGLGDMEISPDGTTLYIVNLAARQIERYDISQVMPIRLDPIAIPLQTVSANIPTQQFLRPFALEFAPLLHEDESPRLFVGLTNINAPSAHVLEWNVSTGTWRHVLIQSLTSAELNSRLSGTLFDQALKRLYPDATFQGWYPWSNDFSRMLPIHSNSHIYYPQPFLVDIEFSPDGQAMRLGFRDRTGDITFFNNPPLRQFIAISQGDTLSYRSTNNQWQLELNDRPYDHVKESDPNFLFRAHSTDWVNDNRVIFDKAPPPHVENHMGGIVSIPAPLGELVVTTSLFGAGSSGLGIYHLPERNRQASLTLIPSGTSKAPGLGDLELLCTYAFIRGQLWHDVNGNGVREAGEALLNGIRLEVVDPVRSTILGQVVTAADGSYTIAVPPNRALHLRVALSEFAAGRPLAGMVYAPVNAGADDSRDSDAHPVFGVVEFAGRHTGNGVTGAALPLPVREATIRHIDIGLTRQFQPAMIGDRVWHDLNRNGVQDNNEPGVAGVSLRLERLPGSAPAINAYPRVTVSDGQGRYTFANLEPGQYRVVVAGTQGYAFAPFGRGGNAPLDSDVDEQTGASAVIVLGYGAIRSDIDVGLVSQPQTDLSIALSGTAEAVVGDELVYNVTYRSAGNVAATHVEVRMELPSGATFLSASHAPNQSGATLIWQFARLEPNAAGAIAVRVHAPAAIGASLHQTVTATATISSNPPDHNPANNSASQQTRLTLAELSISKEAPAAVLSGDTLLYTLRVVNRGSAPAANVTITDPLPAQVDVTSILRAPAGTCRYEGAQHTLRCTISSIAPNEEVIVSVQTRPRPTAADRLDNRATVTTTTAGDSPADNTAAASTAHVRPNPVVSLAFAPAPAAAGEATELVVGYRNLGNGLARAVTVTVDAPSAATITTWPPMCQRNGYQLTCVLGDVLPAASGELHIGLTLPATIAVDQLAAQATIATTTPELPAYQADNTASATVTIVRPNPFVQLRAPASIVGQGSVFAYTIDYGNLYHRRPAQTRAAANTTLELELPADVQLVGASRLPTSQTGRRLRWDLGMLNPQAAGSIEVVVQTSVPAGAVLPAMARISTSTPADDPVDNVASLTINVVPPPSTIGVASGDLRVAIRSTLDPAANDANQTNGIYLSNGAAIAWPAGEVLDLTPQLANLTFADEPLPWPYAYQARVVGWSLAEVAVGGQRFDPRAADSRGMAGCRPGARPLLTSQLLTGCIYRYLGGQSRDQFGSSVLRERDLDDQIHLYWSRPPAPAMRPDVYLYTTDVLGRARLTIQIELEVQIVNQAPGSIGGVPLPPVSVAPLPNPARQLVTDQIEITLLAPRSLVAPGN
ncbi:SdrD B-like domain-containing protein [Chloroflexus sp.]|uniref:SdrD B-like domain-containing protein n=1 Tax=Chloroflexus sp. TaxID=1904827 RepID=UPI002ACDA807|nr:SdrD B-like domain-containing protein [Chloroflexus sp.]